MSQILIDAKDKILLFRLAIMRAIFFSANSLGSAIMVALAGTIWSDSDGQTKFLIVISILVNWSNTIMAFLDKTMQRLNNNQSPLTSGDTEFIEKPKE